ncbi:ATP-binding protein [Frankia sp. CcWB2]
MSAFSVPMDVVRQATSSCPPATHILAELPYLPSAVPQARRVLREGIRLADLPEDVRGTAELLVSELVTNAVKYGQPPLWLLIEIRPGLIHASVSDTSTVLPQRREAAPDAEGGRGLLVLDTLAGSWGTVAVESGKYLWFDLPVPVLPAPVMGRRSTSVPEADGAASPDAGNSSLPEGPSSADGSSPTEPAEPTAVTRSAPAARCSPPIRPPAASASASALLSSAFGMSPFPVLSRRSRSDRAGSGRTGAARAGWEAARPNDAKAAVTIITKGL